jgi:hypothetical protein
VAQSTRNAALKEALIKSHMRDRSTFVPCFCHVCGEAKDFSNSARLHLHKTAPVPRKRCNLIGLRQLQRLLRCTACQGTYLGCAATPCIHLHLTQRESRDLISAPLILAALRRELPPFETDGEAINCHRN